MKKLMLQGAAAAIFGVAALAGTATTASAYVVCNRSGDCWHTSSATTIVRISASLSMTTIGVGAIVIGTAATIAGASMTAAVIGVMESGSLSKSFDKETAAFGRRFCFNPGE